MVIDFALVLDGYHVDQTRMLCWGTPSDEVMRAYNDMLAVEQAVIGMLTPGTPWEDVYTASAELAAEMGYADIFMGSGTEQVRFVGHGVGLELDEPPLLAPKMPDLLAERMVIAIEPKVALPGIGVVGIEDTVVVGRDGVRVLTPCSTDFILVS